MTDFTLLGMDQLVGSENVDQVMHSVPLLPDLSLFGQRTAVESPFNFLS